MTLIAGFCDLTDTLLAA